MANVFGILTAIVLALAAFVAYKNKAAYQAEIAEKDTQVQNVTKSQQRLKEAQEATAAVIEKRTKEVEVDIARLSDEATTLKKTTDDLKTGMEGKAAQVNSNKEKLDDVRAKAASIGDLKGLASKMRQVNAETEELTQTVAAAEAKLANLSAQNNQLEGQLSAARARTEAAGTGQSSPNLSTRIRSVYPTWGFVTLATGNSGGVVANSTLNVLRGGETIAKLLVTTVERGSASASIVPDSMSSDVVLAPGDRVVSAAKAAGPQAN